MAENYTDLSDIVTSGNIVAEEMKAKKVVADEIKKTDGTSLASEAFVDTKLASKPDRERIINGGISRMSNTEGDEGACITFTHNDKSVAGMGVHNGGLLGLAGQIYAVDENKNGTRINITQQKIYYTKRGDATHTDGDEIATKKDITSGGVSWGGISGDIDTQEDLKAKFDAQGTRIGTVEGQISGLQTDIQNVDGKLTTEVTRATTKESQLSVAINDEALRASAEEQKLTDGKLNKLPKEPGSGQEYKFPFNINPIVQEADKISTSFDTLVVNDGVTKNNYPVVIPSADTTNNKAGLFNKAIYDEILTHTGGGSWGSITGNIDDQTDLKTKLEGLDGKITAEKTRAETKETDIISLVGTKADKEVAGANGKAFIFNENDGGGAKFEHTDGTHSFVGVNDGGASGIGVQLYVVNKDDATQGCKLNVEKSRITYVKNKATTLRTEDDEIATKGDVKSLGGTFRGNFATKADLLAYTGPKEENDYAIVDKDESQTPSGDCWRYRYIKSSATWKAEYKVREQDVIKLLGNEEGSGQPYHFPFNINALVQNADSISTTFDTITLDNNKTKTSYPIAIPSADVANDKAGLYNKALADKKADADALTQEIARAKTEEAKKADKTEIPTQYLTDASVASEKLVITKKDGTTVEFEGGSKDAIRLLGNEAGSGEPYHFTYFYTVTPEAEQVKVGIETITLDNNKTLKHYEMPIGKMDGTNAGLYTKSLADAKLDVSATVTNAEIDAMFAEW